jgi:hypothetical protein
LTLVSVFEDSREEISARRKIDHARRPKIRGATQSLTADQREHIEHELRLAGALASHEDRQTGAIMSDIKRTRFGYSEK